MYARFDLSSPRSLDEALAACGAAEPPMLLAGGTVALVEIRAGKSDPRALLSLDRLSDLRGIGREGPALVLGARTTVTDLLESPLVAGLAPALADAAGRFAGLMVRNAATVGGNIAAGSPAADLVPPLLTLDAQVELARQGATRQVPLSEYFTGYKRTLRQPGEIITRVILPDPRPGDFNAFYKLARRRGDAITVVGVAVTVRHEGEVCSHARIALGSVGPMPLRARRAEALLEGRPLDAAAIEAAAAAAEAESTPIDDVRASGAYRRRMVRVLVRRLLGQAAGRPEGGDGR